jgi:hypothetical protein
MNHQPLVYMAPAMLQKSRAINISPEGGSLCNRGFSGCGPDPMGESFR